MKTVFIGLVFGTLFQTGLEFEAVIPEEQVFSFKRTEIKKSRGKGKGKPVFFHK
jgi:hypothetical protein